MPRKLDPALTAKIRAFLATPDSASLTLAEIAARFNVSVWVIHRHRNALASPTGRDIVDRAIADAEKDPRKFIDRIMGGQATLLSPGPPLTEDGRVDRLALMMSACGLPTIRRALAKAFPNARALQKSLDAPSDQLDPIEDEDDRLAT